MPFRTPDDDRLPDDKKFQIPKKGIVSRGRESEEAVE
jgi:hypothetical protein